MIEEFLIFLNQPWASWMFGEVILVWGFISWLVLRLQHHRPIQASLEDAVAVLDLYPNQKLFIDHFQHVDGQLTNNRLLAKEWFAFKRNLIVVDGANSVLGTKNPDDYFNLDNILKDFELHYYKYMPRYLVGTGLLISFTFLITGLFFVSKEFAASDVNHSQQVLGSFLNEVSFKFFPVLVGMFTGLIFSWGQRNQAYRQNQQLDYFIYLLNQRIDFNDLEGNAAKGGVKDNSYFADNSMNRIVNHLDSSMDNLTKKTVNEVIAAVESLTDEVRKERGKKPVLSKDSDNKISIDLDEQLTNIIQTTLTPILDSVRAEITGLAKSQERTIRESLGEMTTPTSEPGEAKQLLVSVQKDMDQLLVRQEQVIQKGLGKITQQLAELFPEGKPTTVAFESTSDATQEGIDKITELLQGPAFIEPIIATIRNEGTQFSKQNKEVSKELLNDATARLHKQIEAETQNLRRTSDRIDKSVSNLEENAGKLANQSINIVEEALREEGARLLENNQQALRETLGELTNQFQSQFNATTDELIQASKRLDQSATVFTKKTDEIKESTQENLLEAVLSEGIKTRELMQDQPLLDQVAQALKAQSQELARSQSQTLQQALGDIAVKGSDGEVTIEPLLAAVKSESEKQLGRQDSIIRDALSSAVTELNRSLSPDNLITTIKNETSRLAKAQETINLDLANLNKTLASDNILSAIQDQTDAIKSTQETISVDLAKISNSVNQEGKPADQDSIISAIQDQTDRLAKIQNAINSDIAKLGDSLSGDTIIEDIQAQTSQLLEKVSDISLEPVLEALKTQSDELTKSQSQVLQQVLGDISVRGADGEITVEPIIAAVKAASQKQLEQQDAIIREALDGTVAKLNRSLSPDIVIEAIQKHSNSLSTQQESLSQDIAGLNKSLSNDNVIEAIQKHSDSLSTQQESLSQDIAELNKALASDSVMETLQAHTEMLSKQQEALSQDIAELNQSISSDSVIEAIQNQTDQITENQDAITVEIAKLGDSIDQDSLLANMQSQTAQLLDSISNISIEPVLDALKTQSQEIAKSQTQALHKAIGDVAVKDLDGKISIDPLLAAIKDGTQQQLEQQESLVRKALDSAVSDFNRSQTHDSESVLEAIHAQTTSLNQQQEALNQNISVLNESINQDSVLDALKSHTDLIDEKQNAIIENIDKLDNSITIDALQADLQSQNAKLLDSISSISLEPVIDAIKTHSQDIANSHSQSLQQALEDIVIRGGEGEIAIDPLLAAVKAGSERQLEQQENIVRKALDSAVADLNRSLAPDTATVIEAIENQTASISQDIAKISAANSSDDVIEAINQQSQQLAQKQDAITVDIAKLGDSIDNDAQLANIQAQNAKLIDGISGISQPILQALKTHSQEMAKSQSQTLQQALNDIAVRGDNGEMAIDPLLAAVKAGSERQLEQQENIVRKALDSAVADLNRSLAPDTATVIEAIENQTASISQDIAKISAANSSDDVIDAIHSQTEQIAAKTDMLAQKQDAIAVDIAKLGDTQDNDALLADIQEQNTKLIDGISAISIEPILQALKTQSQEMAKSQSQTLQQALNEIVVRGGDGEMAIDPLLAAVKAGSERQLEQQESIVRNALDSAVADLNRSLAPNSDLVIDAIQSQTTQITEKQDAITLNMGRLEQALDSDALVAKIEAQNAKIIAGISNISLDPVLEAIKTQSQEMAKIQSQTLQQALDDIIVRGSDGEISIDPLLAAVKAGSERQLKEQETIIDKALEIAVADLKKSLTPDTDTVIEAIQNQADNISEEIAELNASITTDSIIDAIQLQSEQMAEKQDAITVDIAKLGESIGSDAILAEIQSQNRQLIDKISDISLEPILQAITTQGEEIATKQSQTLQQILNDIAVRNIDGELEIEPILAAVKAGSERQLEQQESLVHKALNSAVAELSKKVAPNTDKLIATIKAQTGDLGKDISKLKTALSSDEMLNDIKRQNAKLLDRVSGISLKPILDTFKSQSKKMAKSQSKALQHSLANIAVRQGDGKVSIDPILAAVKAESARQLEQQETIIHNALQSAVAELNESLAPNTQGVLDAIEAQTAQMTQQQSSINVDIAKLSQSINNDEILDEIRGQTAQIQQTVAGISMEPVLKALKQLGQQVSKNQSQALQQVLGDIAVRGGDGKITIEPLLAAVKAESTRQLDQNETVIRDALDSAVADLNRSLAPDTQSVIAAIQAQTEKLAAKQEAITVDLAKIGKSIGNDNLLQDMKNQNAELLDKVSAISIAPVLAALENHAENQNEALEVALGEIVESSGDNELTIEPLLAAIRTESDRQLEQQSSIIKDALDSAVNGLNQSLAPEKVLQAIDDVAERQEFLNNNIEGLEDSLSNENIIVALQAETAQLMEKQDKTIREAITDISFDKAVAQINSHTSKLADNQNIDMHAALSDLVNSLNDSFSIDEMIDVLQNGTEQLMKSQEKLLKDELAGLSLEPVLAALGNQSEQLVKTQTMVLHDTLSDIAVSNSDGGTAIEPLIATMKAENLHQIERQENVIRSILGELVNDVSAIKTEAFNLSERLDANSGPNAMFIETVVESVRTEAQNVILNQNENIRQLMDEINITATDGIGQADVVSAVRDELAKLSSMQESFVREAFANASLESAELISMEPLLDAVQNQTSYLADTLQQTIHATFAKQNDGSSDGWTLAPVLDAIKTQGEELAINQTRVMQEILAEVTIPNSSNEPVLETIIDAIVDVIKSESERVLSRQSEIVREAMGSVIASVDELYSTDTVIESINFESNRVLEQLAEGQNAQNLSLETILTALRDQGEHILENHSQTLQDALENVGMQGANGISDLEAVVVAVKQEGERLLQTQSEAVKESITQAVNDLASGALTPDSLVDSMKTEMSRLVELVERFNDNQEFNLEPVVAAIQKESVTLSDSLTTIIESLIADSTRNNSPNSLALEPVLEEIRESGGRILAQLDANSISSQLTDILHSENEKLVERLTKQVTLEPILEVLQSQSEIAAAHQTQTIRDTMSDLMAGGGMSQAMERVIESIQIESANIIEQVTEQVTIAPVAKSLEEYMEKISSDQFDTLQNTMTEVATRYADGQMNFKPLIAVIQEEGAKVSTRISDQLASSNILEILRGEVGQLVKSQSKQLQEALDSITKHANTKLDLEPILEALQTSSKELTQNLEDRITLTPVLNAVKEESERLIKSQSELMEKAIVKTVHENGQNIDLQPILEIMRDESQHLMQELHETSNIAPVLDAIKNESAKLLHDQSQLIEEAVNRAVQQSGQNIDLNSVIAAVEATSQNLAQELKEKTAIEPLLAAVREESARLIESQSKLTQKAIQVAVQQSGKDVDMQSVISTMQEESQQLAQELKEKTSLETVLASVKEESARLKQSQAEVVDQAIARAIRESGQNIDLQPILSAIQNESHRQIQELSEKITLLEDQDIDLQPLIAAIQSESQHLTAELRAQAMADNREHNSRRLEIVNSINVQGDRISSQLAGQSPKETAKAVASLIGPSIANQTNTITKAISVAINNLGKDLTPEGLLETIKTESNRIASSLEAAINNKATPTKIEIAEPISADIVRSAIKSETSKLASLLDKTLQTTTAKLEEQKNLQAVSVDSVKSAVKSETSKLESLLDKTLQTTAAKLEEQKNLQAVSADSVRSAVKSETSKLESLLDKSLQTTASKLEEQKNLQEATAKLVEQHTKPVPAPTPAPEPKQDRPKWALSAPGEVYSDVVGVAGKKLVQSPAPINVAKEIHWDVAKTPARTFTAQSIEGKSLIELMKSMKQYLIDQFGEQSDYLTKSIQELVDRIEDNHPISEPEVIALLREIGDRSNLIMTSYNPDVPRVANLDKGFLKTAKELQKQVDELAATKQGTTSSRSQTLSNSLDPDNFRQKVLHQFSAKKSPKSANLVRQERLIKAEQDKKTPEPQKPQTEPAPAKQTKPAFVSAKPISVVSSPANIVTDKPTVHSVPADSQQVAPVKPQVAVPVKQQLAATTKPQVVAPVKAKAAPPVKSAHVSPKQIAVAKTTPSTVSQKQQQTPQAKPGFIPGKPANVIPAGVAPAKRGSGFVAPEPLSVVPIISKERALTKQEIMWQKSSDKKQTPTTPETTAPAASKADVAKPQANQVAATKPVVKPTAGVRKPNEPTNLTPRSVTSKMKNSFFNSFLKKSRDD
ncbi:MAG: hypothetical protein HQL69_08135 [Magnetococcales bacterium]|nr:hypothetical protein [Magnetococcales bacterium]